MWQTILPKSSVNKGKKRKRPLVPDVDEDDVQQKEEEDAAEQEEKSLASEKEDGSDSEGLLTSARGTAKKRHKRDRTDPTVRQPGQRRGLEAEDDIPDVDQDEEDDQDAEDAPQDSDFEEGSEDDVDDYNAEQYFESGEGDDFEDGGGAGGEDAYD